MNTEATARVILPGNKTGSVPDLTITDDDGERRTLWDFTAFAPEHQTLEGAASLLRDNGWRPASGYEGLYAEATWHEAGDGRWTLSVEAI
jgi:hypothetical protein